MRKTTDVTIEAEGRDKGKMFRVTEMPALQAETWAMRALFMLAKSGANIPQELTAGGMSTIATLGLQALLYVDYNDAKPLLDELLTCIKIKEPNIVRDLAPDDVEEVQTFFTLRGEALKLHLGFFQSAEPSKSSSEDRTSSSSTTQTSHERSARSSHPAK